MDAWVLDITLTQNSHFGCSFEFKVGFFVFFNSMSEGSKWLELVLYYKG